MSSLKPHPHEPLGRALALARRYLRFGTRSTIELVTYLKTKRLPPDAIASVIETCQKASLLDDRSCARLWASHAAEQGYALGAIRQRLLAKGLDSDLVDEVLKRFRLDADDATRARNLVHASLHGHARADECLRRRLARRLAQRGFEPELIEQVLVDFFGPLPEP